MEATRHKGIEDKEIVQLLQPLKFVNKDIQAQVSLYVKGFGAAAVQRLWLQRRTLLKNIKYERANFSYYRNLEQR